MSLIPWSRAEVEHVIAQALRDRIRARGLRGMVVEEVDAEADAECIVDALGLPDTFTVVAGRLEQVAWVAPVRTDGTIDGKWWHYRNDEKRPANVEPVFRVVDRSDTA